MDWKLLISSLIFVAVTIIKLVFPEQTLDLRRQAVALIDMDMNYRKVFIEVGTLLSEDSVREVVGTVEELSEGIAPHKTELFLSDYEEHAVIPKETVSEQEVSSNTLEKVEAFHRAQEAYVDYDTPSNVSYDCLEIPFSYENPVSAVCSSGFGYRVHPIDGQVLFHYGTDYDVKEGTDVRSFADGVVTAVGTESGYGNYICVDHGSGWETLYAHCSKITVSSNQTVSKGEILGQSGSTGRVTGPHLHFELMHNDIYTNPEFFLP